MAHEIDPRSRIGFLGPIGTFTEQALLTQGDLAAAQLEARGSFADILFAVADDELDYGFVAVENAIEGTVNVTMDTLAFDVDLVIQREVVLPVEMDLMLTPGVELASIKKVSSFPHAYSQCRRWLRENLPDAELVAAASTAEAAELVARGALRDTAAIANSRAADVYGLQIAARDIEDHPENATRFALVGRSGIPAPTGHDRTTIVVFQRADAPGSLLAVLQEFAARQINLSLLLSRPTRTALGDYCFLIDLEGHVADEVVADALRCLKAKQADVKFLGSYPRGDAAGQVTRHQADAAGRDAQAWLSGLRRQIHD